MYCTLNCLVDVLLYVLLVHSIIYIALSLKVEEQLDTKYFKTKYLYFFKYFLIKMSYVSV